MKGWTAVNERRLRPGSTVDLNGAVPLVLAAQVQIDVAVLAPPEPGERRLKLISLADIYQAGT
jgi:hypothetical protein